MDKPNSDVAVDEPHGQANKKDYINRAALCNSFNSAISIIRKRKGKYIVEETSNSFECKKWASKKRPLESSDSSEGRDCKCSKGSSGVSFLKRSLSLETEMGEGSYAGDHHMPNPQLSPLHVMLNRDFIVTSPLKQNLRLTMALTQKQRDDLEKLILVGHFRAIMSFWQFGLGPDALRVRTEANAGGTSTISEALSVEYFVRRFQAKDIVTEMEVEYCSMNWKKVDYICTLYGQQVGVSVTRAMSYPDPEQFSQDMANKLLHKKLFGLVVAREGVADRHCFSQCILHVWCETERTARLLEAEYLEVSQELEITDDLIMVLTVADGFRAKPIFYEHFLIGEGHLGGSV